MSDARKGRMLLITLVVLGVAGGIAAAVEMHKQIVRLVNDEATYQKYKCNPFYMPFIHLSKFAGTPEESAAVKRDRNFKQCVAEVASPIIDEERKPLVSLMGRLTELNEKLGKETNVFRTMAGYLRASYMSTIKMTVDRVLGLKDAVTNQYNVVQNLMKKQSAMFALLMEMMKSSELLFTSLMTGPIPKLTIFILYFWWMFFFFVMMCIACRISKMKGNFIGTVIFCPICALCFHPSTEIPTSRGLITMRDVKVGDHLADHSLVLGKINVFVGGTELYRIPVAGQNPVEISDSHLVFEDGKWKRVRDSKCATLINKQYNGELVCLITSNNRIKIGNREFRDYQEISEPHYAAEIKQRYINHLNGTTNAISPTADDKKHTYYWGFDGATIIRTGVGNKTIRFINIGDTIVRPDGKEDTVIGKVSYSSNMPMYTYKGIRASGSTIVKEDGKWIQLYQAADAIRSSYDTMVWNLITESGEIHIGETVWRDFMDSHDEGFNDSIDDYLEELANSLGED